MWNLAPPRDICEPTFAALPSDSDLGELGIRGTGPAKSRLRDDLGARRTPTHLGRLRGIEGPDVGDGGFSSVKPIAQGSIEAIHADSTRRIIRRYGIPSIISTLR